LFWALSTGTTTDDYVDPMNPCRSLPAANALHQNTTLYAKPVLPQMEAVGRQNHSQWKALMDKAFIISVYRNSYQMESTVSFWKFAWHPKSIITRTWLTSVVTI
jgi:hypothetical protein